MKLTDKLLKNTKDNSSSEEKPYIGISEQLDFESSKIANDQSITIFEIIRDIFNGAESDSIYGLKIRLEQIKNLKTFLSSTRKIDKNDRKVLYSILNKIHVAIKKHFKVKSSKINILKNSIAGMIDSDIISNTFDNSGVTLLMLSAKKIKNIYDRRKERNKLKKQQIRNDNLKIYSSELKLNRMKDNSDFSETTTDTYPSESFIPNYVNESESQIYNSDVASQPINNPNPLIHSDLNVIIDKLSPLEQISKDIQNLLEIEQKRSNNEYKDRFSKLENELESKKGGKVSDVIINPKNSKETNSSNIMGLIGAGLLAYLAKNALVDKDINETISEEANNYVKEKTGGLIESTPPAMILSGSTSIPKNPKKNNYNKKPSKKSSSLSRSKGKNTIEKAIKFTKDVGKQTGLNKVTKSTGKYLAKAFRFVGGVITPAVTGAISANERFTKGENAKEISIGVGSEITGSVVGSGIGQAAIPIPFVGGLIGSVAGGYAGELIGNAINDHNTIRDAEKSIQENLKRIKLLKQEQEPIEKKSSRKNRRKELQDIKNNRRKRQQERHSMLFSDTYNFDSYARAIATNESSNEPMAINSAGYVGLYQMGALALEDAGFIKPGLGKYGNDVLIDPNSWTIGDGQGLSEFLSNPNLQKKAFYNYTEKNKKILHKKGIINNNSTPGDIASALAGSHLVGVNSYAKKIKTGIEKFDGNNTASSIWENVGRSSQDINKRNVSERSRIASQKPIIIQNNDNKTINTNNVVGGGGNSSPPLTPENHCTSSATESFIRACGM